MVVACVAAVDSITLALIIAANQTNGNNAELMVVVSFLLRICELT